MSFAFNVSETVPMQKKSGEISGNRLILGETCDLFGATTVLSILFIDLLTELFVIEPTFCRKW